MILCNLHAQFKTRLHISICDIKTDGSREVTTKYNFVTGYSIKRTFRGEQHNINANGTNIFCFCSPMSHNLF